MKELLNAILTRVLEVPAIKYADENWGQLSEHGNEPPVKFPAVLVDVGVSEWKNQGELVQDGDVTVTLKVAVLRISNSSNGAPEAQREHAFEIFDIMSAIHRKLQGWQPSESASRMYRIFSRKTGVSGGIKQWDMMYKVRLTDRSADRTADYIPVNVTSLEIRDMEH